MWLWNNVPNSRDNIEGRRIARPVSYDMDYPLHLPQNHVHNLRPEGSFRAPPTTGIEAPMSDSASLRAQHNMTSPDNFRMINTTSERFKVASAADTLDDTTDSIQNSKVLGALSTYDGVRYLGRSGFIKQPGPANLAKGVKAPPATYRLGIPGVSDLVKGVTHDLPQMAGFKGHDPTKWTTIKAPKFVDKGLNKVTDWYAGKVKKYPGFLGKAVPGLNAVANIAGFAQLGAMGIDMVSGKSKRQARRAQNAQEQQYQSSFRQAPNMRGR